MKYKQFEEIIKKWEGKICIFGAGLIGRTWAYDIVEGAGGKIAYYIDNNISVDTEIRDGVKICSSKDFDEIKQNCLVLIAVKESYQKEIINQLNQNGVVNILCMGDDFLQEFIYSVQNENDSNVLKRYKMVIDDAEFLKKQFRYRLGYELNLDNPKTFNEKIQWQKLYDRNPIYTVMSDKVAVKEYVANIIGDKYIIPTLGVWNNVEDIDFGKLPEKFILKCNHNSGLGMYICKDKSKMPVNTVKSALKKGLEQNYYLTAREWSYKNIPPCILAEELLEDGEHVVPEDYKVYCMDGEPKYIVVFHDRFNDTVSPSESVYDIHWQKQEMSFDDGFKISNLKQSKPECLDELLDITRKLCCGMKQCRIDFYIINNKIYFGEITLYTAAGWAKTIPEEIDQILGSLIK